MDASRLLLSRFNGLVIVIPFIFRRPLETQGQWKAEREKEREREREREIEKYT